ncbi:MAG: glycosyl hydrolase family 28-related protein, partial [Anaerolineae bacterium]
MGRRCWTLIWAGILILALSTCGPATPAVDTTLTTTASLPATTTPTVTAALTITPLFTETLTVKRATYYRFAARIYKASDDEFAYVDMGDMEEGLRLEVERGVGGGQLTSVEGLWYSGERTRVDVRGMGQSDDTSFEALSLEEVTDMAKPRRSQIVTPVYPTDDVVVIDFNVLDYDADPEGVRDASDAIQHALDDCHHTGGGTVWMPVGTYKVTRTIFVWPFCTLRGDWRDPDSAPEDGAPEDKGGDYGTVIQADVAPGSDPLFLIGGSAATMGLTVYYPNQNATNPVPYGWTFEIRGNGWSGNANYHASSVIDC